MGPHTRLIAAAVLGALPVAACAGADDDPVGQETEAGADDPAGDESRTAAAEDAAADTSAATGTSAPPAADDAAPTVPSLEVEVVMEGLSIPWDVQLLPDGTALVTERGGRLLALDDADDPGGGPREVEIDLSDLFVGSEAGLMGMAVSPEFDDDRTIFLCHATTPADAAPDVRVTRWSLDDDVTEATQEGVVVDGLPLTTGRHAGCRLLFTDDGTLLVGTGDAADETNPQSLTSLGGKVLALTPDGDPTEAGGHVEGGDERILTYGHRNVQGLAVQPGTGAVWSIEHGPDRDDEVNILVPGANYGWDPGPGYDESVPMTDSGKFPGAVEAVWSSGYPTHATSGGVFLEGEGWGAWEGALAVAELKNSGVTVFLVDGEEITDSTVAPELDGSYGRLRSVTLDDEGRLWVTSSNGENDVVLRVTPRTG